MALEKEMETYRRELPNLLSQAGKFVLIHDDAVVDVYGTYEDALKAGYKLARLQPFLVKQIQATEQVQFITRHFGELCHI